jgi:hypothetical protein
LRPFSLPLAATEGKHSITAALQGDAKAAHHARSLAELLLEQELAT